MSRLPYLAVIAFSCQPTQGMQLQQAPIHEQDLHSRHRHTVSIERAAADQEMTELFTRFKGARFGDGEPSPWKAVKAQEADRGRNICIQGKQVPDFYVLGVQKCATTTLAENFMGAGMSNVHGDLNPKEFHWFDHRMDYLLEGVEFAKTNVDEWLSWMPKCPEALAGEAAPRRNALADFTPDYLRIVPRPTEEMAMDPKYWMKVQEMDIMGPEKMKNMYGERAKDLQFAIMFREPLAQMQSAWYHAASFNFTNACKSCRAESFKAALMSNMWRLKLSTPRLSPWVWTTMYARQMEPWLKHFNASQFYIIPMKQLTSDKKDQICEDIAGRLDFNVNCNSQGAESLHSWSHEHPPVNEDAGAMRAAFDEFMAPENAKFVSLLAEGSLNGMGLANYRGRPGDVVAIKEWLDSSW